MIRINDSIRLIRPGTEDKGGKNTNPRTERPNIDPATRNVVNSNAQSSSSNQENTNNTRQN